MFVKLHQRKASRLAPDHFNRILGGIDRFVSHDGGGQAARNLRQIFQPRHRLLDCAEGPNLLHLRERGNRLGNRITSIAIDLDHRPVTDCLGHRPVAGDIFLGIEPNLHLEDGIAMLVKRSDSLGRHLSRFIQMDKAHQG